MPRRRWCRCSRRGQGGSRFRQAQKGVGGKQPRRVIHLRPALLLPHMHLKAVIKQISRVASNMEQRRQRKRGEQCADASRRLQQLIVFCCSKVPEVLSLSFSSRSASSSGATFVRPRTLQNSNQLRARPSACRSGSRHRHRLAVWE